MTKQNKIEINKKTLTLFLAMLTIIILVSITLFGTNYWAEQKGIETGKNQTLNNITLMSEVSNQINLIQYSQNKAIGVYSFDNKTNLTYLGIFTLNQTEVYNGSKRIK